MAFERNINNSENLTIISYPIKTGYFPSNRSLSVIINLSFTFHLQPINKGADVILISHMISWVNTHVLIATFYNINMIFFLKMNSHG